MKRTFDHPRIIREGSLRNVTAAASLDISDARLKRNVEEYDAVLPRLQALASAGNRESLPGGRKFERPTVHRAGSLKNVTAIISEPTGSDANLKTDVESYDSVLTRLKELSTSEQSDGTGTFEKPAVRREGSLKDVTAIISGLDQ